MSFDAHSLERLRQLGRSLPERLPQPEAPASTAQPSPAAGKRHKVETETDPEALFRELMQVSPDGNVPPHLLDRLRQAEATRQGQRGQAGGGSALKTGVAKQDRRPNRSQRPPTSGEELELYTAFQQLLLEDEDEA